MIKIKGNKMTREECIEKTKKFTEENFKNPPPLEERTLEYKIAYTNWARDNGLLIEFNSTEEALEWLYNKCGIAT